jgi:phosphatidate cytidylyltransferase
VKPEQKNLLVRVATAVIGLPIIGGLIYWQVTLGFLGLCLLVTILALVEYTGLTLKGRPSSERVGIVLVGAALFLALTQRPEKGLAWSFAALLAVVLLMLPRATDIPAAWSRLAFSGFGVLYVGGLTAALPIIRDSLGASWVALVVAMTFANDTGAYFVGRAIGRHKLAPSISPGKTIEGAVGGLLGSLIIVFTAHFTFLPELSLRDCLMIGVPSAVVGPAGDLMESLIKRAAGAKDSGRLLPGHGGILDRIDALLFVGAYVSLYATLLK